MTLRWYDANGVTHEIWSDGTTLHAHARCRSRWNSDQLECVGRYAPTTEPITCIMCVTGRKADHI